MVSVSPLLRGPLGCGLAGASWVATRGSPWATAVYVANDSNHIHPRKQMCDIREKKKQKLTWTRTYTHKCASINKCSCAPQPHVKRQQAKINEAICYSSSLHRNSMVEVSSHAHGLRLCNSLKVLHLLNTGTLRPSQTEDKRQKMTHRGNVIISLLTVKGSSHSGEGQWHLFNNVLSDRPQRNKKQIQ